METGEWPASVRSRHSPSCGQTAAPGRQRAAGQPSVVPVEVLASLELVDRAAIRALRLPGVGHVQVDLGVAVPDLHVRLGVGAKDAALVVQVLGQQLDLHLAHVISIS
jgi:hypothetical protein